MIGLFFLHIVEIPLLSIATALTMSLYCLFLGPFFLVFLPLVLSSSILQGIISLLNLTQSNLFKLEKMKESFLLDEKKNPISIVTLFVIPLKKPMSQNEYDKEELAL